MTVETNGGCYINRHLSFPSSSLQHLPVASRRLVGVVDIMATMT